MAKNNYLHVVKHPRCIDYTAYTNKQCRLLNDAEFRRFSTFFRPDAEYDKNKAIAELSTLRDYTLFRMDELRRIESAWNVARGKAKATVSYRLFRHDDELISDAAAEVLSHSRSMYQEMKRIVFEEGGVLNKLNAEDRAAILAQANTLDALMAQTLESEEEILMVFYNTPRRQLFEKTMQGVFDFFDSPLEKLLDFLELILKAVGVLLYVLTGAIIVDRVFFRGSENNSSNLHSKKGDSVCQKQQRK